MNTRPVRFTSSCFFATVCVVCLCACAQALEMRIRAPMPRPEGIPLEPPRGTVNTTFRGDVVVSGAAKGEPEFWVTVLDELGRTRQIGREAGVRSICWDDGHYTIFLPGKALGRLGRYRVSAFVRDGAGATASIEEFGRIRLAEAAYDTPHDDPLRKWPFWPPYPEHNTHIRVCRGQAQPLVIAPLNLSGGGSKGWTLEIDLPEGVSLMDPAGRTVNFDRPVIARPKAVTREGGKYVRQAVQSRWSVHASRRRMHEARYPQRGGQWLVCILRAAPGAPLGRTKGYWRETVPPANRPGPWQEIVFEVLPKAVGNPAAGLEIEACITWPQRSFAAT